MNLGGTANILRPNVDGVFLLQKNRKEVEKMLGKKYKASETEAKWKKYWDEKEIYKFDEGKSEVVFSIDTPPPTVSGKLHIGHIFSYTQAEMIARFKRMQGYNVYYPFAFDDNGLPTERLVEKDLKINAKDMSREEFTKKCYQVITGYEEEFKHLWKSLGISCDWSLCYETISPMVQRISQRSFLDLLKKKKAYREESPVLYCTNCETSIAQAEVETLEKDTTFNYIKFQCDDETLEIATTRPELLYSCQAIFIHPSDEKNKHLIGKLAKVPLYDFEVKIMADKDVDMSKGSGMVMCCTFGDSKDLEWYKRYAFEYKKTIEANGFINSEVPLIASMHIKKARKLILELLEKESLLLDKKTITHTVSIHERCSTEIEIIPSMQWFIDVLSIKKELISLADDINWYPSHMKNRYINWVENLKWDWCISRQRYFGVPLPIWYCKNCGEIKTCDESELPINPLTTSPKTSCSCGCKDFDPEKDVMDTWATSSVTPLINARWKEDNEKEYLMPMGLRTQAHEIIRTWTFYTIVKSYYHLGQIPWKDIMLCGFVLARKGEKISKSKGNSKIEPMKLISAHSADEVRYWAASAKLGTDTTFAEEDLKISRRFITKLWNASKFSLMHLEDYNFNKPKKLLVQDKWILDKARRTLNELEGLLNKYEVGRARNVLDDFFWKDYCDNYLELVKDRVYKPELHGYDERLSGQYAIYNTLLIILKAYSVFTPYITEEIYHSYFTKTEKEQSIHLTKWNTADIFNYDTSGIEEIIKLILTEVRKYKSDMSMSMKDEINELSIYLTDSIKENIKEMLLDIKTTTHSRKINLINNERIKVLINE